MIDVIMTSYNRPELLSRAVNSVGTQDFGLWRVIIVDDHSNGPTRRVLKQLDGSYDGRVEVVSGVPLGQRREDMVRYAANINKGIELTNGYYITYLTDDDEYLPGRFSVMVDALGLGADVVYGAQETVEPDGRVWIRETFGVTREPAEQIDHNSIMHRRACLERLDPPYWPTSPEYWSAADAIFFTRLAEHYDFFPVPAITDKHYKHTNRIQHRMAQGKSPIYN